MVTAVNTPALVGTLLRPAEWLDPGNKSPSTAEDPQAVVVKISAEGAQRAEAVTQAATQPATQAATQAAPNAEDLPVRLDGGGSGQVSVQEFKASEPKAPPAGGARAAAPAGGQAPAGGAGGGVAAASVSTTPSSSQTYEPADTDEDGTVSPLEQQAYEVKLAAEKAAKAAEAAGSERTAEAAAAVKAYEAIEQLGASDQG